MTTNMAAKPQRQHQQATGGSRDPAQVAELGEGAWLRAVPMWGDAAWILRPIP